MSSKGSYRTDRLRGSIIEQCFRLLTELGGQATVGQLARKLNLDARRVDKHLSVEARTVRSVGRVGTSQGVPLLDRTWRRVSAGVG